MLDGRGPHTRPFHYYPSTNSAPIDLNQPVQVIPMTPIEVANNNPTTPSGQPVMVIPSTPPNQPIMVVNMPPSSMQPTETFPPSPGNPSPGGQPVMTAGGGATMPPSQPIMVLPAPPPNFPGPTPSPTPTPTPVQNPGPVGTPSPSGPPIMLPNNVLIIPSRISASGQQSLTNLTNQINQFMQINMNIKSGKYRLPNAPGTGFAGGPSQLGGINGAGPYAPPGGVDL